MNYACVIYEVKYLEYIRCIRFDEIKERNIEKIFEILMKRRCKSRILVSSLAAALLPRFNLSGLCGKNEKKDLTNDRRKTRKNVTFVQSEAELE